jgi:poly-gamma-glutamate capsule biosynthesis protein CapA/YwtB (metallophosphatase superfamily)
MAAAPVRLFASGDVMAGRGVGQILPHPGDPELRECYDDDARAYVRLAERASGPIPQPVSFLWPWGDALQVLDAMAPDIRLISLETAVTQLADFAPGKAVHYRMSPRNLPCVAAARPDVCALANNHVLDFRQMGLEETLSALARAGLTAAGTGPGVSFLPSLSGASAGSLIARAEAARQDGDLVAVSIHWGANWGYSVTADQVRFAHRLIDGGISLIHGHSSHHPRPAEVYRAGSSATAAATASTTTRASADTRSSVTSCGCCTSRP